MSKHLVTQNFLHMQRKHEVVSHVLRELGLTMAPTTQLSRGHQNFFSLQNFHNLVKNYNFITLFKIQVK